jgi:hypothetical protein
MSSSTALRPVPPIILDKLETAVGVLCTISPESHVTLRRPVNHAGTHGIGLASWTLVESTAAISFPESRRRQIQSRLLADMETS